MNTNNNLNNISQSKIRGSNLIKTLSSKKSNITTIAISSHSKFVGLGLKNGIVKIYETANDKRPLKVKTKNCCDITSIIFSECNDIIIIADKSGSITISKLKNTFKPLTFKCHSSSINKIQLNSYNKLLVTCSNDKTIKLWNISLKRATLKFNSSINIHANWVLDLKLTTDNHTIISVDSKNIKMYGMADARETFSFTDDISEITCIDTNYTDSVLAVGNKVGKLRVFDLRTKRLVQSYNLGAKINSINFNSKRNILIVSTDDNTGIVHFIDIEEGRNILTLENIGSKINNCRFSLESQYCIFSSLNNCQLWEINIINNIIKHNYDNKVTDINNNEIIDDHKNNIIYEQLVNKLNDFSNNINNLTNKIEFLDNKISLNEHKTNELLQIMEKNSKNNSNMASEYKFDNTNDEYNIDKIIEKIGTIDNKFAKTMNNTDLFSFKNYNNTNNEYNNFELNNNNSLSFYNNITKINEETNKNCIFDDVLGVSLKIPDREINNAINSLNTNDYNYTNN